MDTKTLLKTNPPWRSGILSIGCNNSSPFLSESIETQTWLCFFIVVIIVHWAIGNSTWLISQSDSESEKHYVSGSNDKRMLICISIGQKDNLAIDLIDVDSRPWSVQPSDIRKPRLYEHFKPGIPCRAKLLHVEPTPRPKSWKRKKCIEVNQYFVWIDTLVTHLLSLIWGIEWSSNRQRRV